MNLHSCIRSSSRTSDTSPKECAGLSGGIFNTFGNIASITTPIIIGYIVNATGSFNGALVFVGANAIAAVLSYLFLVGPKAYCRALPRV